MPRVLTVSGFASSPLFLFLRCNISLFMWNCSFSGILHFLLASQFSSSRPNSKGSFLSSTAQGMWRWGCTTPGVFHFPAREQGCLAFLTLTGEPKSTSLLVREAKAMLMLPERGKTVPIPHQASKELGLCHVYATGFREHPSPIASHPPILFLLTPLFPRAYKQFSSKGSF